MVEGILYNLVEKTREAELAVIRLLLAKRFDPADECYFMVLQGHFQQVNKMLKEWLNELEKGN